MTDQVRAALADRDLRYGSRRVVKMYDQINALRQAILAGDMLATQAAWGDVEQHIDFAYQMAAGSMLQGEG